MPSSLYYVQPSSLIFTNSPTRRPPTQLPFPSPPDHTNSKTKHLNHETLTCSQQLAHCSTSQHTMLMSVPGATPAPGTHVIAQQVALPVHPVPWP